MPMRQMQDTPHQQYHPQSFLQPNAQLNLPPHPITSPSHAHYIHVGPNEVQPSPSMVAPHYDTHSFAAFNAPDDKMPAGARVRQGELRVGQQLAESTFAMHGDDSLTRIVQENGEEVAYVPCRVASENGDLFCYVKARLHSKARDEKSIGEKLKSKAASCEPRSSSIMTQTNPLSLRNQEVETSESLLGARATQRRQQQSPGRQQPGDVVFEPDVGAFLLIKDAAGRVLFEPVVEAQRATRGMMTSEAVAEAARTMDAATGTADAGDELVSYLIEPYKREVGVMASPGRQVPEPVASAESSTRMSMLRSVSWSFSP